MKLGALNTAIRDHQGAPWIEPNVLGAPMRLEILKTPLLASLKARYPEGRSHETGLKLLPSGRLVAEAWDDPSTATPTPTTEQEDDLIG